jgi:flagellar FliL protein
MADEKEVKEASGGKGAFIVVVLLLAVLGAGAGAGFSTTFLSASVTPDLGKSEVVGGNGKQNGAAPAAKSATKPEDVPKENVVSLDPILITLAGNQKSWARVELGVVVEPTEGKEDQALLLKTVTEGMMTFLRTVPLTHVETAAGLEYLREDLTEIVQKRSKGRVRGVVLRSLVVE